MTEQNANRLKDYLQKEQDEREKLAPKEFIKDSLIILSPVILIAVGLFVLTWLM